MNFAGEQLLPGQIGHFLAVLSLMASLTATISYFLAHRTTGLQENEGWLKIARIAFFIEVFAVIGIFVSLYFIISRHLFEYRYAWQHSNLALPMQYILSCFWEGQEGSFLLWSFWHCILGLILIRKEKQWEAPVMTVISFMQLLLATMVIGIYFFDFKIGSSPFVLMRNEDMLSPDRFPVGFMPDGSLRNDYLNFIRDGNGLNPLLQNYWMTIHPPVLFLGFASTIVPFAYAIAGLWTKNYSGWIAAARPWALFSAGILGLGIMMGAAWAYESLTFGGYWAWDPVENASLVPWIVLITAIHTMLIYQHSGNALRSTFLFFILQFLLIVYSTFLTRSGILGDTSVHAFTDLGMNGQLMFFLFSFLAPSLLLFVFHYKKIPAPAKEEHFSSREFWMFVGSLLLFISAAYIIFNTSLPVVNKIFGTKLAPPQDIEYAYNKVLILFGFVVSMLTAFVQYLKYKQTSASFIFKRILAPTILALVVSVVVIYFGEIKFNRYGAGFLGAIWLSIFASLYAVFANAYYLWVGVKGKLASAGASIAHIGFGMVLLGALVSSSKKEVLSWNTSGIMVNFGEQSKENPAENLTLVQGVATDMGKYMVTYLGDSTAPLDPKQYFKIKFDYKDSSKSFTLYPDAFVNFKGNGQLIANPDSKNYLHKDVFTYITSLPDPEKNKDTAQFQEKTVRPGDTVFYSGGYIYLESIKSSHNRKNIEILPGDSIFAANFSVVSKDSSRYRAEPLLILRENRPIPVPDTLVSQGVELVFTGADAKGIKLGLKERNSILNYITLKAYQFPAINILWLGVIIMTFGFLLSMYHQFSKNRILKK